MEARVSRILLCLLTLYFGLSLLFVGEDKLANYLSWGFTREMIRVAGLLQALGAILLWWSPARFVGLLMIWSVISVAFITHWKQGHNTWMFLPAISVGGLCVWQALTLRSARALGKS